MGPAQSRCSLTAAAQHPPSGRGRATRQHLAQWSMLKKQPPAASETSDVLKRIQRDSGEASVSTDLSSVGVSDRPSLSSCPGELGGPCEQGSPGPRRGQGPRPSGSRPGHCEIPAPPSAGHHVDSRRLQPPAHVPGQPPPLCPFTPAAAILAEAKSRQSLWPETLQEA